MERYDLPEGWLSLPFEKAVKRVKSRGIKLKTEDYKSSGAIPIVDQGQSEIVGYTEKTDALFQGPVPVIIFGDHTKNIKYIDFDFAVGAEGVIVLRPIDDIISKFFYYWLKSIPLHGLGYSRHYKLLIEQVVCFPGDKSEQRRIVKRIEGLTKLVEESRKLIRLAMQDISYLNPSLLDHLFQMAEAKNWRKVELGEISTIIMGQSPKGSSYNLNGRGVPLLNGPTEFGREHPTPAQWTTEPTRLCEKGDILFCVRGSTTGRMNWADQQYCLGRGLAAIRPHQEKCLPGFVYAFVQTQSAAILHQGEGGVFPNFNRDQLISMEIPLPPIDEQRHVVEFINKCQTKAHAVKQLQADTEEELAVFTPALLAKAFRGEL